MTVSVPDGWHKRKLGDICEIVGGGTPATEKPEYWGGSIPWATPTEITNNSVRYISATNRNITELGLKESSAKIHPIGTVLMTSRASIGYAAINTVPMSTNQGFQSLRPSLEANGEFLYQCITFNRNRLESLASGSTFLEVSSSAVKNFEIPVPPLPEQQKIAAILTSVDEVIEKTQLQITKLQDLKKATMNDLLTKGIGHTAFKDSEVGRIPSTWDVVPLNEVLAFISYGFTNPMPTTEAGPFMVTAKDVVDGRINYKTARMTSEIAYSKTLTDKSKPQVNDILLTKDGTLGRLAIVDRPNICINQSVAVLRINSTADTRFVFHLLSSPKYQRKMLDDAGGSTIKHIYITVVDKMEIGLPNITEQLKIVNVLDELDNLIRHNEEKLYRIKALKKSLMQDLLTGKVRVKVD